MILTNGPSWTFMDPQKDPKMDPATQILGDPDQLKAPQGHFKVHIDKFDLHRPLDNRKFFIDSLVRSIRYLVPEK